MTSKLLTAGSVAPIDAGLDLVDPVDRALDRGPAGRPVPEGAGAGRPVGPLSHDPRRRPGLSHRVNGDRRDGIPRPGDPGARHGGG